MSMLRDMIRKMVKKQIEAMVEKEVKSILEEDLYGEENSNPSEPKKEVNANQSEPIIEACQFVSNQGAMEQDDQPYCSCGCGALWSYEGDFCPSCQTECG